MAYPLLELISYSYSYSYNQGSNFLSLSNYLISVFVRLHMRGFYRIIRVVHDNYIKKQDVISVVITVFALLIILFSMPDHLCAQMVQLDDEELSSIQAAGFSNFSVTNGIATAALNISGATYTEIDSMKLGYYNRSGSNGWDEDWTNVDIGTSSANVTFDGLFIEAKFTNIDDPATRTLDYVRFGTDELNGDITAELNSFTGDVGGVSYVRSNLGTSTISSNGKFYVELDKTTGFRIVFNSATVTSK